MAVLQFGLLISVSGYNQNMFSLGVNVSGSITYMSQKVDQRIQEILVQERAQQQQDGQQQQRSTTLTPQQQKQQHQPHVQQ